MSLIIEMYEKGYSMDIIIRQKKSFLNSDKAAGILKVKSVTVQMAKEAVYQELYGYLIEQKKERV